MNKCTTHRNDRRDAQRDIVLDFHRGCSPNDRELR